jgi:hypothetical protein
MAWDTASIFTVAAALVGGLSGLGALGWKVAEMGKAKEQPTLPPYPHQPQPIDPTHEFRITALEGKMREMQDDQVEFGNALARIEATQEERERARVERTRKETTRHG